MRRSSFLAVALVASLFPTLTAQAAGFDPNQIAFPVGGNEYRITDSFGDPRGDHAHEGVDIMAPKGTEVYAAADGVAHWVSASQAECCRLQIDHGDGWATRYIHLNDDTQNSDGSYNTDDAGWGIAEGITDGTPVSKGQLIGWVGDSGNATEGVPHLHFELRQYDGEIWNSTPIDPYAYLLKAEGGNTARFIDTQGNTHEENIDKIFEAGITYGCNPPLNTMFCPERNITRGEMAAFIVRTLGLSGDPDPAPYDDIAASTFKKDIDRLHAAGIAFGCDADSYCPGRPLIREEMAELLVRAYEYENPEGTDHFTDDEASDFEESINALASVEVTLGCNPPANDNFCPERTLTRAEMASFFARAEGL